jgi:hypothetical protein
MTLELLWGVVQFAALIGLCAAIGCAVALIVAMPILFVVSLTLEWMLDW